VLARDPPLTLSGLVPSACCDEITGSGFSGELTRLAGAIARCSDRSQNEHYGESPTFFGDYQHQPSNGNRRTIRALRNLF
jgi:hypothetical protein